MSAGQVWAVGMSLTLGAGSTLGLLMIWWVGWANNWEIHASWNLYHEAWLEGVVLHAIAVLLLVMIWKVKKWQR